MFAIFKMKYFIKDYQNTSERCDAVNGTATLHQDLSERQHSRNTGGSQRYPLKKDDLYLLQDIFLFLKYFISVRYCWFLKYYRHNSK